MNNNNFDWKTYINNYKDLRNSGINTYESAINHWNLYGKKEGRTYETIYKHNLSLIAIFKNESHILKEWIEHYIKEGVDKFYLIDNDSEDNYIDILKPYVDKNIVDIIVDTNKHVQNELYNKYFLEKIKTDKWVIVCDLDEFIYSRNGYNKISDYLDTIPENINQVYTLWKMFGSNGHIDQPDSVIKSFTKRFEYKNKKTTPVKTISRGKCIVKIDLHLSKCDGIHIICSDNIKINNNNKTQITSEDILSNCNLHLNHYAIQSLKWFIKVKMTRGAADNPKNKNIRNLTYFKNYDHNHITDDELVNKIYLL